jgi:hypothetical protein
MCTYWTVRTGGRNPILVKGPQAKAEALAHLDNKPLESQGESNVISLRLIFCGPQPGLLRKRFLTQEQD